MKPRWVKKLHAILEAFSLLKKGVDFLAVRAQVYFWHQQHTSCHVPPSGRQMGFCAFTAFWSPKPLLHPGLRWEGFLWGQSADTGAGNLQNPQPQTKAQRNPTTPSPKKPINKILFIFVSELPRAGARAVLRLQAAQRGARPVGQMAAVRAAFAGRNAPDNA